LANAEVEAEEVLRIWPEVEEDEEDRRSSFCGCDVECETEAE
jgi:hypothetical protein